MTAAIRSGRATILTALVGLPAAATVALASCDTPLLDDWATVRLFTRIRAGTLTLVQLFEQHNESRKALPRLLWGAIGAVTTDFRAQCAASVVLAALVCWLLLRAADRAAVGPLGSLAIGATLLALPQYENLLWGIQLSVWCVLLLLVLAATLVGSESASRRGVGLLCAIAAPFTYVNGLFVLPALLPAYLLGAAPRERRRRGAVLAAIAWGAAVAAFFIGYVRPLQNPTLTFRPIRVALYFMTFLGSPWAVGPLRSAAFAEIVGLLLVAAFSALALAEIRPARRTRSGGVFLSIGLFALASAFANAVGRAGFGTENALASRYATIGLLLGAATLGLAFLRLGAARARHVLAAVAIAVAVLVDFASVRPIAAMATGLRQVRAITSFLLVSDDPLLARRIWPKPDHIRGIARDALAEGLFDPPLFAPHEIRIGREARGFVDELRCASAECSASGWLVMPRGRAADAVAALCRDAAGGLAVAGLSDSRVDRPDVVAAVPGAPLDCGFRITFRSCAAEADPVVVGVDADRRDLSPPGMAVRRAP